MLTLNGAARRVTAPQLDRLMKDARQRHSDAVLVSGEVEVSGEVSRTRIGLYRTYERRREESF